MKSQRKSDWLEAARTLRGNSPKEISTLGERRVGHHGWEIKSIKLNRLMILNSIQAAVQCVIMGGTSLMLLLHAGEHRDHDHHHRHHHHHLGRNVLFSYLMSSEFLQGSWFWRRFSTYWVGLWQGGVFFNCLPWCLEDSVVWNCDQPNV